jgi:hypothetical protein
LDSLEEVDLHYRRHLGEGVEYRSFEPPQPGLVGVLEWPVEASHVGIPFYATLGLHKLIHHGKDVHQGLELFTGLTHGSDGFRRSFALMVNDLIIEQIHVEAGHLVSPQRGRIMDGFSFTSWLVIERADDLLPDIRLKDGSLVTFLNVIPIFKEEVECIKSLGHEALFEVWDRDRTYTSDWHRELPLSLR